MKTVLAPGAPWPNWEEVSDKKQTKPRKQKKQSEPRPPLAISGNVLDFFAEAREQIATGKARSKVKNPVNNFHEFNKRRT
jgi:hypothetical protein